MINNLEHKLGEVENSNKILSQEVNLLKSGRDNITSEGINQVYSGLNSLNTNQTCQNQNISPNYRQCHSHEQVCCVNHLNNSQCHRQCHLHEPVVGINNINNISQMNGRLRSMEYGMTNRISNIEDLLHQQQRVQ